MRWLVPFYKIWPISPTMSQGSYLFCLSILPVRNIMLHIQKSVKKKKNKKEILLINTNQLSEDFYDPW